MAEQTQTPPKHKSDSNAGFLRAARDGNLEDVLHYLRGSTDINTSNPNGLNALHLASKEGHFRIVSELIRRGANVEAATKKGNTALHIASLAGHEDIVKKLVENGAQVNLQAQAGFTPLYMASQEGHAEVVKFLLANGANQSLSTEDGFTPLAVALQQGHDKVVTVLLEHDAKGKVRLPALHIAAKKDDVKSAALLLQNEQNSVELQTKGGLVNDTTKSGFTPLHIAAHYGNTNVANLLIQRGADVNFRAKNNITPLHVCSRWGKLNMVNLLVDNNANIDEKTRDGLTPLHCAARSGHDSVVDALLERGAPNSAKTKNGLTPLHMAAQGDHEDCARLLLYHKASLNEVTVDYLTPLHVAAHCGNVKTAKLLLDRKCEPNARALNGFTPLHIACKKNRIKVVELLLKYGASIESKTESGLTPLHVASFMGHMNIVIYLIQHNANPNTTTVRGETSLHLAARANQSDIIRILLRNGATVDARAREQQTPLHIAARLGNVDNVVLLLQHGALVDAATKDKYTPLHIAAKEGHDEVAQVLLEHEAQHDVTTKKGFTPLHIAAKYGNIKVARLLLQKGANPNVQGKNGLTPLHVATHYNHPSVAQLLLESKANPHATAKNGYTPLHIAAKKNQMDIATMLLEYGAKPNAESKNGFTPLHLASQEGHTDIVSLLLEKDANVNCQAHNGLTPMHLAAQEDRVPVAEILVKYGSEIDTNTKAGYTPLHTACHFGQVNMVRFLLNHEASVNATTKVGYTPLHQAAQQGHVQVVSLLLKNQASPNAVTNNGQTPLAIAQKLGYISVVEILKPVTEVQAITPATEDKYKVVSPETMQETFISDSEDEGDDKRSSYISRDDSISLERGGSASPLDISFDKDVQMRYPATDSRGRQISQIGATMHYPSYLESNPDYEAEMRYYHGDTLSPQDKNASADKSRTDSVFYSGDYSTLGSNRDSLNLGSRELSTGGSTADIYGGDDDDLKYVADDAYLRKDYMDAQMSSQLSQSLVYSAAPPVTGRQTKGTEPNRYSSYSGSSFSTNFDPDNVPVDRSPVSSGFLISFMVDARGGAMRGYRHPGVRIIIPSRKCCMPTRITCRLVKREKLTKPPPMLEGEGLAARVLEMGPVGTKFLGPILLEVPHFASLRGKEREVVVLRSDNGESWYEHPVQATEDAVVEALGTSAEGGIHGSQPSVSSLWQLDSEEDLSKKRIKRILTTDLPMYFALVSRVTRVKQESTVIGMEGGVLSSNVVPQVQAVLPEGTLTRPIPVGLQAQPIAPELVAKLLGNRVAVSPIVTIEPRRRKFHKPITLTIPVPRAAQKGMINQYGGDRPTLRLLFSLAADPNPAQWEDVTDSKPMTLVDDCVSFTTTVSARFWLIDCPNVAEAAQMASVLYQEAVTVPYMAKFVVFAKRDSPAEGKLRIFCMTDDKDEKTLEKQEKFYEVARSRDIEVLEGRPQFVEMAGNLIPVTKSGDQLHVNFRAFRENRLPCIVKVRDQDQEPSARVAFMKEPKVARGEAPQTPICNLNIRLPDLVSSDSSGELDTDRAAEIQKRHDFLRGQGLVIQDTVSRSELRLSDIADAVQGDWVVLAQQLNISISDINHIKNDYKTVADQALAMLNLWVQRNGDKATGNQLETALRKINREDVVKKCMYNVTRVDDEAEAAAARLIIDRSGFDTFKDRVGITRDSLKRDMSLDVQYDEQDIIKDSESAAEESPKRTHPPDDIRDRSSERSTEVPTSRQQSISESILEADVYERRPQALKSPEEDDADKKRRKEAYLELALQMDQFAEMQESDYKQRRDSDQHSIKEEAIVKSTRASPNEVIPTFVGSSTDFPQQKAVTEGSDVTFLEEPVLETESNITEVATRLASSADVHYSSEKGDVDVDQLGQVRTEREVMYSRADVVYQGSQNVPSETSSQIVSPLSEGGHSYQDVPSSVPEPRLPDGFRADELAYEKDEEEYDTDYGKDKFEDARDESYHFRRGDDKTFDMSSDADIYRTADQSLEDRLDQSRSSDVDGGRYGYGRASESVVEDIQERTLIAEHEYPGDKQVKGSRPYPGDYDRSDVGGKDDSGYPEDNGKSAEDDRRDKSYPDENIYREQEYPEEERYDDSSEFPDKIQIEVGTTDELLRARLGDRTFTQLSENIGSSVDHLGSPVDATDHIREHYAKGLPVQEAAKFDRVQVEESKPVEVTSRVFRDTAASLGDEDFVDRREETIPPERYVLSRQDIALSSTGFQVTSPTPLPRTIIGTALVVDESTLASDEGDAEGEAEYDVEVASRGQTGSSLEGSSVDIHVEGPQDEETEVDEHEEVLPDGTVHHTRRVRTHSFKKFEGGAGVVEEGKPEIVSELAKEDIVEIFNEPPRLVRETEKVEHVLSDGARVQRQVVFNRMIHRTRTHQEHFDSDLGRQTEDFEIAEIIPGTVSAFVAGSDSSDSEWTDEEDRDVGKSEEKREAVDDDADVRNRLSTADLSTAAKFAHIEPLGKESTAERAWESEEDTYARGAHSVADYEQPQLAATTSHDTTRDEVDSELPEEWHELDESGYVNRQVRKVTYHSDSFDTSGGLSLDTSASQWKNVTAGSESYSSSYQGDDDVQSHRLMMKKEIHRRTLIGADGKEQTSVMEDSQIQQDAEPPEELRESMQQIIDQFMEMIPQPIQLPQSDPQEDEV